MQRLKAIQQRVFCIFFRPYQRSQRPETPGYDWGTNVPRPPRARAVNMLVQVDFNDLAWYDPSQVGDCPPCPREDGWYCPPCPEVPRTFRPLGPLESSVPPEITNPNSTRLLEYQEEALQYYNYSTDQDGNKIKTRKPFILDDSRTLQPFNEDKMFAGDLWFLHSTWTSFEKTKLILRPLIDAFGFDAIMVCGYVPIDMEILPNK